MDPLRVAVCGGGRMGRIRWGLLQTLPGASPVGVFDSSADVRASLAAADIPTFASLQTLLPLVDALIVCTWTMEHKPLIFAAAAAGKHVFCEKPLAHGREEIAQCHARASAANILLRTGWMKRHDPKFLALKTALGAEPWLHISMVNRDNPFPDPSLLCKMGDLWADCAVHEMNLALWFSGGEMPATVSASGSRSFNAGAIDRTATLLTFKDGRTISIENSRHSPEGRGYDQRVEVVTRSRCLRAEDAPGERYHSFGDRYAEAFRAELALFVEEAAARMGGGGGGGGGGAPQAAPCDEPVARLAELALESHLRRAAVPVEGSGGGGGGGGGGPTLRFLGHGKFGRAMAAIAARTPFTLLPPATRASGGAGAAAADGGAAGAVYVVTPDEEHAAHAEACLAAGKHVLVEKPVLGFARVRAQAMSNACVLMVGFQRRFDAAFCAAKAAMAARAAPPAAVDIFSAEPGPAAGSFAGSAALRARVAENSLVHDVDLLRWLLPAGSAWEVQAVEAAREGMAVRVLFTHEGGGTTLGTIRFAREAAQYSQWVSFDGARFGHDTAPTQRADGQHWVDAYEPACACAATPPAAARHRWRLPRSPPTHPPTICTRRGHVQPLPRACVGARSGPHAARLVCAHL